MKKSISKRMVSGVTALLLTVSALSLPGGNGDLLAAAANESVLSVAPSQANGEYDLTDKATLLAGETIAAGKNLAETVNY